jgi:hypothetical protein
MISWYASAGRGRTTDDDDDWSLLSFRELLPLPLDDIATS